MDTSPSSPSSPSLRGTSAPAATPEDPTGLHRRLETLLCAALANTGDRAALRETLDWLDYLDTFGCPEDAIDAYFAYLETGSLGCAA